MNGAGVTNLNVVQLFKILLKYLECRVNFLFVFFLFLFIFTKMSGQWEVVGRKKDRSKLPIAIPINGELAKKKPGLSNAPVKIEDIFSKEQVKNLYTITKDKQGLKKVQDKSQKAVNVKKPTQTPKKMDKSPEVKIPKSIDSALTNIDADELREIFQKCQIAFPDQQTIWLKEVVNYLNRKIPLEISDPIFASKSDGFPWIVIPTVIKIVIESTIKQIESDNTQLFFKISLNTMIDDMSKQHTAIGSKIYLQYMAMNDPKIVLQHLPYYNNKLKNSYQNQTPIGQSICWVFAQAGLKNFNIGFEVFQNMFMDLLPLKNYSRFVTKYLVDLVNRNSSASISNSEYFLLADLICSSKKNFPTDLAKDLINLMPKLNNMLFNDNKSCNSQLIEALLKRVQTNKQYSEYTCQSIILALSTSSESYNAWKKIYSSNIASSAVVLNHIVDNWKRNKSIISSKQFADALTTFTKMNEGLMEDKKIDGDIFKCVRAIKILNQKMAAKKKSSCPCRYIPFLMFLSASIWICYDVSKHGSWNDSCTSKALNRTGMYDYTNQVLDHAHQGSLWVHDRIEEKFPGFCAGAQELTEPYVELCGHLRKIGCNLFGNMKEYVVTKAPLVQETIEYYAPGVMDTTRDYAYIAWNSVVDCNYKVFTYLRDDVFVGNLSPENMKNVALEIASKAYKTASEGVKWVYEKIETATK